MKSTPRVPDATVNVGQHAPLRDFTVLVIGAILAVFATIFVLAGFTDIAVHFVPVDSEQAVFKPVVADFAEAFGDTVSNPDIQSRLQQLVDTLKPYVKATGYDFAVSVVCDKTPNAFALPGGAILVTSGMLHALRTENELAFVLGHEMGHFQHRDHLRGLGRGVLVSLVAGMVGSTGASELIQTMSGAALASHSREQERAADTVGLQAIMGHYGHAGGAAEVMRLLAEVGKEGVTTRMDFSRSHPASAQRAELMQQLIVEKGWPKTGAMTPLSGLYKPDCTPTQQNEVD